MATCPDQQAVGEFLYKKIKEVLSHNVGKVITVILKKNGEASIAVC